MDDQIRDKSLDQSVEEILNEYNRGSFSVEKPRLADVVPEEPTRRIELGSTETAVSSAQIESVEAPSPEAIPCPEPEPKPVPMPGDDEDPLLRDIPAYQKPTIQQTEDTGKYASVGYTDYETEFSMDSDVPQRRGLGERIITQAIVLLATIAQRRKQNAAIDHADETPEDDEPEVSLDRAAKHYASQVKPLRLRTRLAAAFCLVLTYVTLAGEWGMPLLGALGTEARVMALVCLVLELTVIIIGLDVFTNGMTNLLRMQPGAETLVALSCLFSIVDAIIIAIKGEGIGLPYCAVSAASMAFALHSGRLTCTGFAATFRTAAQSRSPYAVTAELGVTEDGTALLKSKRGLEGFVRRSEAADLSESAYLLFAPFIIVLTLILSILATIGNGGIVEFFHIFSGILAATATFSCLLAFAKPFCVTARRLRASGAAISGSSGCVDIGKSSGVIVKDNDLFPPGSLKIETIQILEGVFNEKVISYTGSIIAASGSGLTGAFSELMKSCGSTLHKVEDFDCHEGGGLQARIGGEQIFVGTSGFMHLMGVPVAHSVNLKNTVYTAISGVLVGVFTVEYRPLSSVQDALVLMLHNNENPLFAVRDFNISPLLIKQLFRLPTEGLDFPSFAERFHISGVDPDDDSQVAAILSREGLAPIAEASDRGRRLFRSSRLCVTLSVILSLLGAVIMFALCRVAAFESASAANLLIFMILSLAPVMLVSLDLRR